MPLARGSPSRRACALGKETLEPMSNPTPKSKAGTLACVQALVAGTLQHFPNGQFTLGGVAYTTATLVQELRTLEAALLNVNAAQAHAKDAVKALRDTMAKVT